jgi:5'(3')-deoxyribonucleotidase
MVKELKNKFMKKLTILFDLDCIVTEFMQPWVDGINKKYNLKLTVEDVDNWDMGKCSKLQHIKSPGGIYKIINKPMFFYDLNPFPAAVIAINQLVSEGHNVYFLTTPPGALGGYEKLLWVDKFFPAIGHKHTILARDKFMVKGDVFFDDKGSAVELYKKTWPDALVMTIEYTYNTYLQNNNQGIKVVGDYKNITKAWLTALDEIRKKAKEDELVSSSMPPNCT